MADRILRIKLEYGLNNPEYVKAPVKLNDKLYYLDNTKNEKFIGTLADVKRESGRFSNNGVYSGIRKENTAAEFLGTFEALQDKLYSKMTEEEFKGPGYGGKRKSRHNLKNNKKSRKGKSRNNRRKSNHR